MKENISKIQVNISYTYIYIEYKSYFIKTCLHLYTIIITSLLYGGDCCLTTITLNLL